MMRGGSYEICLKLGVFDAVHSISVQADGSSLSHLLLPWACNTVEGEFGGADLVG